jgi:hypothetical protein
MCDQQNNLGSYFTAYVKVTDLLQPDLNHEELRSPVMGLFTV